jgi:hypothetical protein
MILLQPDTFDLFVVVVFNKVTGGKLVDVFFFPTKRRG